jgi:tRNA threonylcarbamoyladenosine biosynthesis protein TsaB
MKVLALDTATEACSVSLLIGTQRLDRYQEMERGQAELILPLVESVLDEAGVTLQQLDAIAFGRGPGGFTGVRLAASVVQGLAFGAGIGVVSVSDLAAVALQASRRLPAARTVLVANDARMKEVYWAHFDPDALLISSGLHPSGTERVDAPGLVVLPEVPAGQPWLAAGRGLRAWPDLAERCRVAGATVLPELLPRASEVLDLALPRVQAGQLLDPTEALPVYVRDRVAESSL